MCCCFLLIDVKAQPTVHQLSDEGSVQDSVVFCGFAVQVCSSRGWWSWTRTCWSWREETCCWRGRSSAWRYRSSERSWPGRLLEMKFEPRSPNPLKKNTPNRTLNSSDNPLPTEPLCGWTTQCSVWPSPQTLQTFWVQNPALMLMFDSLDDCSCTSLIWTDTCELSSVSVLTVWLNPAIRSSVSFHQRCTQDEIKYDDRLIF